MLSAVHPGFYKHRLPPPAVVLRYIYNQSDRQPAPRTSRAQAQFREISLLCLRSHQHVPRDAAEGCGIVKSSSTVQSQHPQASNHLRLHRSCLPSVQPGGYRYRSCGLRADRRLDHLLLSIARSNTMLTARINATQRPAAASSVSRPSTRRTTARAVVCKAQEDKSAPLEKASERQEPC
mgnify:CR=1 FL=1